MTSINRNPIITPYGYVYIITNTINGKKYIGQRKWKYPNKEDNYMGSGTLLFQSYKKYGKENFNKTIIDWANSKEELDKKEQYWIKLYNATESEEFYNIIGGGTGGETWSYLSKNKQEKIKKHLQYVAVQKGLKPPVQYGKDNYFYNKHFLGEENPRYGSHLTEEQKENLRNKRLGIKLTEETKQKQSVSAKTSKKAQEQRDNLHNLPDLSQRISSGLKNSEKFQKSIKEFNKTKRIAVSQFDKSGTLIASYESIKDAAKHGYSEVGIQNCLKGKLKTSGGYIWKRQN